MRLSCISFTGQGVLLCTTLIQKLECAGHQVLAYGPEKYILKPNTGIIPLSESLKVWTKKQFEICDGIIFVGAAGIAVRAIAPWIQSKDQDPAVVVVDEMGKFGISLLSGHLGGANDLAILVSQLVGAVPVITTATDLNHKFAVDNFAKERNLYLTDLKVAKQISADILSGNQIGFISDFPVRGNLPQDLVSGISQKYGIWITWKQELEKKSVLRLIPKCVILGIGCKRGVELSAIESKVLKVLDQFHIARESIGGIASIDLKQNEPGLSGLCEKWKVIFKTFSAHELNQIAGRFHGSEFVLRTTGVDNVCERAAMAGLILVGGKGRILVEKQSEEGITIAVALADLTIELE